MLVWFAQSHAATLSRDKIARQNRRSDIGLTLSHNFALLLQSEINILQLMSNFKDVIVFYVVNANSGR